MTLIVYFGSKKGYSNYVYLAIKPLENIFLKKFQDKSKQIFTPTLPSILFLILFTPFQHNQIKFRKLSWEWKLFKHSRMVFNLLGKLFFSDESNWLLEKHYNEIILRSSGSRKFLSDFKKGRDWVHSDNHKNNSTILIIFFVKKGKIIFILLLCRKYVW